VDQGVTFGGPDGSGVNGWTQGPLRFLGRLSSAGQRPAVSDTRLRACNLVLHCRSGFGE
jgi:hypothetical protein